MHYSAYYILILAAMATWFLLGGLIGRFSRFYADQIAPTVPNRTVTLDGLRGYLALAVYVAHCMFTRHFLATGVWVPDHKAFVLIGKFAVIFFFMITGFLFWSRAVATQSRIKLWPFYRGRIFRIVPMYVAAVLPILVLVFIHAREEQTDWSTLVRCVGSILTMGFVQWRPLHVFDPSTAQAGVTWTLVHEWRFYLLFPILAVMATRPRFLGLAAAGLAWTLYKHETDFVRYDLIFLYGMATAYIVRSPACVRWSSTPVAGVVALVTILLLPVTFTNGFGLAALSTAFVIFASIAAGNSLLGLLTAAGSRVLGTMSYSIYLIHGMVLFFSRPLLRALLAGTSHPDVVFWLFVAGMGCVVVLMSALTYRWIEHPFIEFEKSMRRRPNAPSTEPSEPSGGQASSAAASTAATGSLGAA